MLEHAKPAAKGLECATPSYTRQLGKARVCYVAEGEGGGGDGRAEADADDEYGMRAKGGERPWDRLRGEVLAFEHGDRDGGGDDERSDEYLRAGVKPAKQGGKGGCEDQRL